MITHSISELFSSTRLIDYFIIFETEVKSIELTSQVTDFISKYPQIRLNPKNNFFPIQYDYHTIASLPEYNYKKEDSDFYTLNINSILSFLPQEYIYLEKQNEQYFSLVFTSEHGTYYYGHFLRVWFNIDKNHSIYKQHAELAKKEIKLYQSKYLCFISQNTFFISFKNLLHEIYTQSTITNGKCYKIEQILITLLYRIVLPKYETVQLLFCLGENVYTFSKAPFKNEISFRLLFSHLSIKNIVMIIISILMNSIVVIIHSNIEIITPIIHCLFQLSFPFVSTYSIVSNLTPGKIDLLGNFSNTIFGVYSKDFSDLSEIKNANNSNYVILDVDRNKIDIEHNEYFQQKFPIDRMRKLIGDLYPLTDIFHSHVGMNGDDIDKVNNINTSNNVNNNDNNSYCSVLNLFENKNLSSFEEYKKTNFRNKNYYTKKSITDSTEFDDHLIRAAFFDFMLGLFEHYDEKKHYKITNEETQDKNFDREKFLKDASKDIQPFLEYIIDQQTFDIFLQNVNHIVDQKHKNEIKKLSYKYADLNIQINPEIREKSLLPNFDLTYKLFMLGLERKKNKKNLETLFKLNIYHSITISSPPYDYINYKQSNIFEDPFNERLLNIHNKAINFNDCNTYIDNVNYHSLFHINLNEQKSLITSHLYNEYDLLINRKTDKSKLDKKVKLNEILTRISTELFTEEITEPIIIEFRNMFYKYSELMKIFYSLIQPETKSYLKKLIDKTKLLSPYLQYESKLNKKDYLTSSKLLLDSFINQKYVDNSNEFRFHFGINVISSIVFCDYCSKPNNIWDIRKEHEYKSIKKTSITKCKFCLQNFVPYFYIIEDEEQQPSSNPTTSLLKISAVASTSSPIQFYKSTTIRKVEFMCYEHIMDYYNEYTITNNDYLFERFPFDLFYNVCFLLGEVLCTCKGEEIKMETIDAFVKEYFNKHPDVNNDNVNVNYGLISNSSKKGSGLKGSFTFKRNVSGFTLNKENGSNNQGLSKRNNNNKTSSKFKSKNENLRKSNKKELTINMKLDLKDLMNDKKYMKLQSTFTPNNLRRGTRVSTLRSSIRPTNIY